MIKQVKFSDYQADIVQMMLDTSHLEPQDVYIPVERYIELDEMGVLKPFLWFDGDVIKGMALLYVSTSLRNKVLIVAQTDVIWVKPEHRGFSRLFVDDIKRQLKKMGVDYWYISSRDKQPIDKFLLRNNFSPLERVYFCKLSEV